VDKTHELGIFFEITPDLASAAGVKYPVNGLFWHDANKIFLSGYNLKDRMKLIDAGLNHFKNVFGYYPAVVGAWHIDAFSANYLAQKYKVVAILICSDQATTDSYRIWGGFWGLAYYPSKDNILTPAQTLKNKIGAVVLHWAQRDPYLGYGGSAYQSSYSFQINDYYSRGLGIDYFNHLLDVYLDQAFPFGQVIIGLENDYPWEKFEQGFYQQLKEVKKRPEVKLVTAGQFASWYKKSFPLLSPEEGVEGTNFFDQSKKAVWRFSPKYRLGLIEENGQIKIRDLRIYNENWPEPNLLTANPWPDLLLAVPAKIDTVQYAEQLIEAPIQLSDPSLIKQFGPQKIPFQANQIWLILFYSVLLLISIFFLKKGILLFLIILGSLSWSIPMVKSGLVYPFGMGFWGANAHDGLWHVALINQLAKFSLKNPVFSGAQLTNYHFGFDLLAALIHRLSGIPVINLYFQFFPPLLAAIIGILVFRLVKKLFGSRSAFWATFFVYFGGSFGWLVSLIRDKSLDGESLFWANQAVSSLINPPYALSILILLLGLNLLADFQRDSQPAKLFLTSLVWGILISIKVYAGLIVLGGLAILTAYLLVFKKSQSRSFLKLFLLTLIISLAVFLPFNPQASGLLVFQPFWFIRSMLFAQDRLFFPKLENARQVYLANHYWLKWFLAEALGLAIFLIGNLGTRFIGLFSWQFCLNFKKPDELKLLLFFMTVISPLGCLLFIQKGNPWNTIQFFYYTQFFLAIFSGVALAKFLENREKVAYRLVGSVLVVALTLPTTIASLKNNYLPGRPPARISFPELEALDYLRKQPEGIVLTYPFVGGTGEFFTAPKPVYAYETTGYVSALSNKPTFLEDEMNLIISQYDWQARKKEIQDFFSSKDQGLGKDFIKKNKIDYLYLQKDQKMEFGEGDIGFKKIFDNSEVRIFELIEKISPAG